MAWYPIGPDFVFAPRRSDFKRLSKRNEWSRQGLVNCIAIDPTDANAIYVTERPTSGGTSAFRTLDGGKSWKPICDILQQGSPDFDPNYIAIDPVDSRIIYMATWGTSQLVRSDNQGDSWTAKQTIPGHTWKLIIDPASAGTPATTIIYAATDNGVYRSTSGGTTGSWTRVLVGDIRALIAIFGTTPVFYASVYRLGIFRSTNPTAAANWTNLNNQGIGLPAHTAPTAAQPEGNFNRIDLDFCPRNPTRIYALFYRTQCDSMGRNCNVITSQLFTTNAGDTAWNEIMMTSPPNPAYGFYCAAFVVAANSPGDGANDILFFGNIGVNRSTNSGRNWVNDGPSQGIWSHADHHFFTFFPANPGAGVIPATFIGNDGGIGRNDRFADPAFPFNAAPEEYNESLTYLPNAAAIQNLNHGKQSSATYQYTGEPSVAALGYIGCQDTGIASSSGSLGWRGVADADGGPVTAARGADGVTLWANLGAPFATHMWRDTGSYSFPYVGGVALGTGGPGINASSNFILGLDNNCLAGIRVLDPNTTIPAGVPMTGVRTVTPASMANIVMGSILTISDAAGSEAVTVTAFTATTFTANFTRTYAAGATVTLNRSYVVRMNHSRVASILSQNLGSNTASVNLVARSPVNADLLVAVSANNRVWITNAGSTASSTTVWTEALTNRPTGLPTITGVAIDNSDNIYVLLESSITTGALEFEVTSPLFKITGGTTWEHQACAGVPTGFSYGNLLADPAEPNVLYASHGGSVFRLTKSGATWNWADMSTGLPGGWIYDMWIGDFGPSGSPNVILRAAIPTRGVWETSPALRNEMPATHLYVRDNILDQALLQPSPDGVTNPFSPSEWVFHYQSVDVKVDVEQPASAGVSAFFQISPEAPLPLNHVFFNQLNDNSGQIPSGGSAYIHVQVHNRGRVIANNVKVWAIYCNAAAGVPALNRSASMGNAFPFWNQFTVTGDILPNLPADSPWRSVGPPVTLSGIDPANPQVASWLWTAPVLPSGVDGGHYCVAVFVHSSASPINESSMNVDEMTPRNKQVAQKNLHIVPAVPASGGGGGGGGGGGAGGVPANYIEFHNADPKSRLSELVFDFTRIPNVIRTQVQFSELTSEKPLSESATGVTRVIKMPPDKIGGPAKRGCLGLLIRFLLRLFGKKFPPESRPIQLMPYGFEMVGSQRGVFPGITITPNAHVVARMYIENTGTLEPGEEYRFDVLHLSGGKTVGGCTYVIPVAGRRKPPQNIVVELQRGDEEREVGEDDPHRFVPPHVKKIVSERRRQMGKEE